MLLGLRAEGLGAAAFTNDCLTPAEAHGLRAKLCLPRAAQT